uniref:hypothetical protein n=1 Tax=Fulvivirga sp. TaxID=1931237 RepID=UPI004049D77F
MKFNNPYFLTIVILSLGMFSSCEENSIDDPPEISLDYPLEGTLWGQTSVVTIGCDDDNENKSVSTECKPDPCSTIQLTNGIAIIVEREEDGDQTAQNSPYRISGDTLIMEYLGFTLSFKYSISGNSLTIIFTNPYTGCEETRKYYGVPGD